VKDTLRQAALQAFEGQFSGEQKKQVLVHKEQGLLRNSIEVEFEVQQGLEGRLALHKFLKCLEVVVED
jgi:hypothetical protein